MKIQKGQTNVQTSFIIFKLIIPLLYGACFAVAQDDLKAYIRLYHRKAAAFRFYIFKGESYGRKGLQFFCRTEPDAAGGP